MPSRFRTQRARFWAVYAISWSIVIGFLGTLGLFTGAGVLVYVVSAVIAVLFAAAIVIVPRVNDWVEGGERR